MSDNISPMPRIRDASRSGWKGSSASVFSPMPRNLMGRSVMVRTDSAAPPRVSASTFVKITPVSGRVLPKAFAVLAASCPVMASTTNRVSIGSTASCSALISAIISSSIASRPAVSTNSTSENATRASAIARFTISIGASEASLGSKRAPTSSASVCSCFMAAGR